MKSLHAILFDLDGTLIDTAGDLIKSLNILLEKKGQKTKDIETMRPHAGQGSYSLIRAAFSKGRSEIELEQLALEFIEIYRAHLHDTTSLFPDAIATISKIKAHGLKWGIVTNKSEHLSVPILQKLGLYDIADCLVYGDTTAEKKPHPEPLRYAAKQLDLSPQYCAYLGDTQNDVIAATHAGMHALAVSYGYRPSESNISEWGAKAIFSTLPELDEWIENFKK